MTVPSVGKSIATDLWDMGFRTIAELKIQNPEKLYSEFEVLRGTHIDRCMLYTFRCIVYYASNNTHDPEKLKWWNWNDK